MADEGGAGAGGGVVDAITGGAAGAAEGGGDGDAAAAAAAAAAAEAGGDGGGAGGEGSGGAADPDWYANLSVETTEGETASNRDWIKAKGFKDLDGVTKALRSAEKAIHDKGLVKIPGEGATPQEIAAYRTATGVPETVDGYKIDPIKDGEGKEVPLDNALLQRLASKAHEIGMPLAMYQAQVQDFVASQLEEFGATDTQMKADAVAWFKGKGEGEAAAKASVNRGADFLGLNGDDVVKMRNELGSAKVLDALSKLGGAMGEDVFRDGGSGKFLADANSAQQQIDAMRNDPATLNKMTVKGSTENTKYLRLSAIVEDAANRKAAGGG